MKVLFLDAFHFQTRTVQKISFSSHRAVQTFLLVLVHTSVFTPYKVCFAFHIQTDNMPKPPSLLCPGPY